MTVTPDGTVLLHDEKETLRFLNQIQKKEKLNKDEKKLLKRYGKNALNRHKAFKWLELERRRILEEKGIEYRLVPSVLESKTMESALNHSNGIFVRKKGKKEKGGHFIYTLKKGDSYSFITTGASTVSEKIFHTKYRQLFKKIFPDYSFFGISGMSKFIAESEGGIRCLTIEGSLYIHK